MVFARLACRAGMVFSNGVDAGLLTSTHEYVMNPYGPPWSAMTWSERGRAMIGDIKAKYRDEVSGTVLLKMQSSLDGPSGDLFMAVRRKDGLWESAPGGKLAFRPLTSNLVARTPLETPKECAVRELQDELGLCPKHLFPIGCVDVSAMLRVHVFVSPVLEPLADMRFKDGQLDFQWVSVDATLAALRDERSIFTFSPCVPSFARALELFSAWRGCRNIDHLSGKCVNCGDIGEAFTPCGCGWACFDPVDNSSHYMFGLWVPGKRPR
jgi:ADP-ribose pyrophosphatase YjhB (NUDIX family)